MNIHQQLVKILAWSIILMMVFVSMGCGHHSSQRSQAHWKKFNKAKMVAHQPTAADLLSSNGKSRGIQGSEGYFGNESGNFADLLDEDALIQEDPYFDQSGQGGDSSGDYWLNRARAEQLTAQSGLEDVHFDFNSVQLNEQAKSILMANAEWLKAHPEAHVTIEGHCDNRGTSSYNYVLGEKRALRTKAFLTGLGVPGERLNVMSYGKDNPACWDATEPCYQKNRRAHLVLGITVASTAMR